MDEKSIKILEAIIMFGPITGPDILAFLKNNHIDVNIKTIYAMIEKWNYFFSQIGDGSMQIVGQKKIGYHLNHPYFSYGQQRFLEDAIHSSSLLNEDEKKHFLSLCHLFPRANKKDTQQGFLHKLNTIESAIQNKKAIKFSYLDYVVNDHENELKIEKIYRQTGNDTKETYLISPYEIMMNRGLYYVLSYCDKHPDTVTIFRLDRMDKIRTVKNEYFDQLKEIVDYETKKKQMIHMFIGQQDQQHVRIKFNKSIFKTIIDEFGSNLELSKDVDGTYILELRDFSISEGLISWIFMMGENVEVIAPLSLKQDIYQRLKKLIDKYQVWGEE